MPWPSHATGVEQHPQSVVLEAGEATSGSLDLLHAEVLALRRTVRGAGAVVVEDLPAPTSECPTEGTDFGDVVGPASCDGLPRRIVASFTSSVR